MGRRLVVSVLVAATALATAGCARSHHQAAAKPKPTSSIEQAFEQLLATRDPGFHGPSLCPTDREARDPNAGAPCVAEIHKGRRYLQVWATVSPGRDAALQHVSSLAWTRRWSKYARPPQGVSPGLISVNAPQSFDWRWLLLGVDYFCRQKHRDTCSAGALDGQWNGYPLFFTFRCRVDGSLISCRNKLGDAVRWRPEATRA